MNNVFRNITPAVAVMVAGLAGAYLVYDNFFSTKNAGIAVASISPAAGEVTEESIILAENNAVEATAETAMEAAPVAEEAVEATAETAMEAAPAVDCAALDAAATAAMGTADAETTQKAAADCHAAATTATEAAGEAMEAAPAAEEVAPAAEDAAAPATEENHEH